MERDKDSVPPPVVTFFQPQSNQEAGRLFSLTTSNEQALQGFLPKSHISNVIIRDNTSIQRVKDIELRFLEDSKRKASNYFEHMKKKFLLDQKNKMNRWKKQYSRYERMLERMDQRASQGNPIPINPFALMIANKSVMQIPRTILKKK